VTHRAPDEGGEIGNHTLPRWFATKGPPPYWLAEHWSLFLALFTIGVVLANTVVTMPGINTATEKWINAVLAWVAAIGLILKDFQANVVKVAAWREQVRNEEAAKKADDEANEREPTEEEQLPYRVHRVQDQAAPTEIEREDEAPRSTESAHDQGGDPHGAV
jgi:hypothetical protein